MLQEGHPLQENADNTLLKLMKYIDRFPQFKQHTLYQLKKLGFS